MKRLLLTVLTLFLLLFISACDAVDSIDPIYTEDESVRISDDSGEGQLRFSGPGFESWSFMNERREIPPIITVFDTFRNRWYSSELFALGEEAIQYASGQVYRFSWLPSMFRYPFVVRIELNDDGTADLFYKLDERIAHGVRRLRSERVELNEAEALEFLNLLHETDFWNLPTEIERLGFDGHRVLIEGVRDGVYHIVDRWVPESDDPVSHIEQFFRALVERKFPEG